MSENAKTFEEIRIAAAGFEVIRKAPPKQDDWSEEALKGVNKDRTFGKGPGIARETASHVVTLLRFGAKPSHRDEIVKALNEGQRQNGGWGMANAARPARS